MVVIPLGARRDVREPTKAGPFRRTSACASQVVGRNVHASVLGRNLRLGGRSAGNRFSYVATPAAWIALPLSAGVEGNEERVGPGNRRGRPRRLRLTPEAARNPHA
jgi:hypothetical protein